MRVHIGKLHLQYHGLNERKEGLGWGWVGGRLRGRMVIVGRSSTLEDRTLFISTGKTILNHFMMPSVT